MKPGFLILLISLICMISCKKNSAMNQAVIVGWNMGYCATCGGFYLNLSEDTAKNSNTRYVINYADNLNPAIAKFYASFENNQKPIPVFVNWESVPQTPGWIRVTAIQPR